MVKTSQHLAGARCQVKLKMWNFYVWLLICGFTREINCADATSVNQAEIQTLSTVSSNDDASKVPSYTEESTSHVYTDQGPDYNEIYRFSRSVPRVKTTSGSSSDSKPKHYRKPDYVLKIPLSVLRQYELLRLLRLQEHEEDEDFKKIMPAPRFDRSNNENDYDAEDIDGMFQSLSSEQENFNEEYLDELVKEEPENASPLIRNSRSILLLTSPKSEESSKEKPTQTFVLPYPRPGRSDTQTKIGKTKSGQLILPYPRPGRSEPLKQLSKIFSVNNIDKKYTLPNARLGRASLNEKSNLITDDRFPLIKSSPFSQKLNSEHLSEKSTDENEGNSLFVIPYPRPGKKAMFKLQNRNQNSKNSEKEITDYVLPYPRPGKKSGRTKETEYFLQIPDTHGLSYALNRNQNTDADNFIEYQIENEIDFPFLRNDRNFDNILPYPRPGRSSSYISSYILPNDIDVNSNGFQVSDSDFKRLEDHTSGIIRFKRSSSVVPYPRPGRSNLVPYPRPGRSNSVLTYPRVGRSDAVVPYPRLGRSISIAQNSHSGRSKRSSSVVPYPRLGRSDSVVPYPRLGRSDSVIPYPRFGRGESIVPYPRPGRSESVVPYPRPGRSNSVVPYPRPGRSYLVKPVSSEMPSYKDSLGYSDTNSNSLSEMNTFRDIRATNNQGYVLPYPRVGRSALQERNKRDSYDTDTVIPYPRLGRSQKETNPIKSLAESQNSVHKLNKHVISSVEDSVYLLPYPRPGRNLK